MWMFTFVSGNAQALIVYLLFPSTMPAVGTTALAVVAGAVTSGTGLWSIGRQATYALSRYSGHAVYRSLFTAPHGDEVYSCAVEFP